MAAARGGSASPRARKRSGAGDDADLPRAAKRNGGRDDTDLPRAAKRNGAGAGADLPRAARRRDARRLAILNAAARVFRERGFAATGMREIAAAADLSPANLYHYFHGKQELLYFCQEASLERLLEALNAAAKRRVPASEKLQAIIQAHVHCVLGEMEGAAAHLEVDDLPPALRRRIVTRRDLYERGIRRMVAAGVASGEFAPCDARLATRAMLGALNWTARWFRPDGAQSPDDVGREFARYLVRGLVARPGVSSERKRA